MHKKNHYFFALIFFIIFSFYFLNECKKENTLKIGIISNFSGPNGGTGVSLIYSIDKSLANSNIKNYRFIISNDSWDPNKIENALDDVLSKKPSLLILATTSTALLKILDRLNSLNIPVISLSSTTTKIVHRNDNIFSFALNMKEEQRQIAENFNSSGWKSIVIIKDNKNYKYTTPALRYFSHYYKGKIEKIFDFKSGNLDIYKLKSFLFSENDFSNVDAFYFLIGYSYEPGIIYQIIREKYLKKPIFLTPWGAENFEIFAGKNIHDVIVATYYNTEKDSYLSKWVKDYEKLFETKVTLLSILGKETANFLKSVYSKDNNLDLISFKRGILKSEEIRNLPVKLDEYGDCMRKIVFVRLDN